MTTLGGVGHTLPFLIPSFRVAFMLAFAVVVVELGLITWIRHRYMDTPVVSAGIQVFVGGALVFLTGVLIWKKDNASPLLQTFLAQVQASQQ